MKVVLAQSRIKLSDSRSPTMFTFSPEPPRCDTPNIHSRVLSEVRQADVKSKLICFSKRAVGLDLEAPPLSCLQSFWATSRQLTTGYSIFRILWTFGYSKRG